MIARTARTFLILGLVAVCALILAEPALSQCAMCKAAVENAKNGAALVRRLNLGIVVLLVPPVAMFCGLFGLAYRHRSTSKDDGRNQ
jgi:hypothetical protein